MKALKILGTFAVVAGFMVAGLASATHAPASASQPREWPLNVSERLACDGLEVRASLLDQEIARVTTDQELRRSIVGIALTLRAIEQRNDELVREARVSHRIPEGVAFVRSGSSWVERK